MLACSGVSSSRHDTHISFPLLILPDLGLVNKQHLTRCRNRTVCLKACLPLLLTINKCNFMRNLAIQTLTMIGNASKAVNTQGISLVGFLTALATSFVVFGVQTGFFLLLRNKLARIL
jgi:predicted membrane-bound spermidine synthase